MGGRKGCLPSIITGVLAVALLVGITWPLNKFSGLVGGIGYVIWGVLWSPLFLFMPLFHGTFDNPTLPAVVLTVIFDVLLFSVLAYIAYWGRKV